MVSTRKSAAKQAEAAPFVPMLSASTTPDHKSSLPQPSPKPSASIAKQASAAPFARMSSAPTTPDHGSSTILHRNPKPSPSVESSPDSKPVKGLKGMFGWVKTPSPRQHKRAEAFFGRTSSPGGSSAGSSSPGSQPRLTHAARLAQEETLMEMERQRKAHQEALECEVEERKRQLLEAQQWGENQRKPTTLAELEREREALNVMRAAQAAEARKWTTIQRATADVKAINGEHVQKVLERASATAQAAAEVQAQAMQSTSGAAPAASSFLHPPVNSSGPPARSTRKRPHAAVEDDNEEVKNVALTAGPARHPVLSPKRPRVEPTRDQHFEVLYIPPGQEQPPPAASPRSPFVSPLQNENHDSQISVVPSPHTREAAPPQAASTASFPTRAQQRAPSSPPHPLNGINPIAEASTRLFSHAARSFVAADHIGQLSAHYAAKAMTATHEYDDRKRYVDAMKMLLGEASYAMAWKLKECEEYMAKAEVLKELLVLNQQWWDDYVEEVQAQGGEVVIGGVPVDGAEQRREVLAGLEDRGDREVLADLQRYVDEDE